MTDHSTSFVNPSAQHMPNMQTPAMNTSTFPMQQPPMKKGFFAKMNKQVLFAVAAVIVFAVGGAAAAYLSNRTQDIRQQAAAVDNCCGQSDYRGGANCTSNDDWVNGYNACQSKACGICGGGSSGGTPPSSGGGGGSGCAEGTKKTRINCGGCLDSKCIPTDDANAAGISKTCNTLIDQYCQVNGCGGEGVVPKAGEQCCSGFQRCPGSGRCGVTCLDSCIGEGSSKPADSSCCEGFVEVKKADNSVTCEKNGTGGTTQKCASPNTCKLASECYGSSGQIESNFTCDGGLVCCKNVACKLVGEVSDSDGACCSGKRDGNKCVSCIADGSTTQSTGDCCSGNAKSVGSSFTCAPSGDADNSIVCGNPGGSGRCKSASYNSCQSGWKLDTSCSSDPNNQYRCCTNDTGRSDHLNGEVCASNADCASELICNSYTKKCEPARATKCSSSSGDARCKGQNRDTACVTNGVAISGSICRGYTSDVNAPCSCLDRHNNDFSVTSSCWDSSCKETAPSTNGKCADGTNPTEKPSRCVCPAGSRLVSSGGYYSKISCACDTKTATTVFDIGQELPWQCLEDNQKCPAGSELISSMNECRCNQAENGAQKFFEIGSKTLPSQCCTKNGSKKDSTQPCCSGFSNPAGTCAPASSTNNLCPSGSTYKAAAATRSGSACSCNYTSNGNPYEFAIRTALLPEQCCRNGTNCKPVTTTTLDCDPNSKYPYTVRSECAEAVGGSCVKEVRNDALECWGPPSTSSTPKKTCWNASCDPTTDLTTGGKCPASHPYVSRPTYCDSSTGQPSNCSAAGASCEATNCCTNGAVCQGVSGNRKCEVPETKDVCPGENATCGANYIAFKCGNFTKECLDNPRDFTNWAEAVAYADGCGQVDQVCNGGSNNRNLCGAFVIFNSKCGGGPGPSPSPSGPVCMNVVLSKQTVKVGDTVSLTCGNVTGATAYEFRIKTPTGAINTIAAQSAGSRNSQDFTISQKGTYKAQCRICTGSSCQEWETL